MVMDHPRVSTLSRSFSQVCVLIIKTWDQTSLSVFIILWNCWREISAGISDCHDFKWRIRIRYWVMVFNDNHEFPTIPSCSRSQSILYRKFDHDSTISCTVLYCIMHKTHIKKLGWDNFKRIFFEWWPRYVLWLQLSTILLPQRDFTEDDIIGILSHEKSYIGHEVERISLPKSNFPSQEFSILLEFNFIFSNIPTFSLCVPCPLYQLNLMNLVLDSMLLVKLNFFEFCVVNLSDPFVIFLDFSARKKSCLWCESINERL